uniref:Uncharacterized protein n=1 Tax=candidate division WOR-3 bacterium TaxID=2052148 RepID=A0A7C4CBT8_UNCW3
MTFALLLSLTAGLFFRDSAAVDAAIRCEPGVETRLLATTTIAVSLVPRLVVSGMAAVAAFDNPGLAGYGVRVLLRPLKQIPVSAAAAITHQQWRDWRTGENRVLGLLSAEPLPGLQISTGMAWRVPVSGDGWASPLRWTSEMPEWNLAYSIRWDFLRRSDWQTAFLVSNLDRLEMSAPQQFPFGLEFSLAVKPRLRLNSHLVASVKGLSGPLVTLGVINARLGVSGDFR